MKLKELIKKAMNLGPVLGIKKLAGYEAVFSWGVRRRIKKITDLRPLLKSFHIQKIIGMQILCCVSMKTIRSYSWSAWTEEPTSVPLDMLI